MKAACAIRPQTGYKSHVLSLYRKLLRAHQIHLEPESLRPVRLQFFFGLTNVIKLGDAYVKAEFKTMKKVKDEEIVQK